MEEVKLERFAYTPHGVFGRIILPEFECYTVERPWMDNKPRQSCIPEGKYKLQLGFFNTGGYPAYEVMNVPGRSLIKIHVGNTIDDIVGCIAPGKALSFLEKKWAVSSSRKAFTEFMKIMNDVETSRIHIFRYKP